MVVYKRYRLEIASAIIQLFTAHSLRSLEPQRTQRYFVLLFSVDLAFSGTGTPENNKKHPLRAFRALKYRVAIDFFSFAVLSTSKEKYLFFALSASLR